MPSFDIPPPVEFTDSSMIEAKAQLEESKVLAQKLYASNLGEQDRKNVHKELMISLIKLRMLNWNAQMTVISIKQSTNSAKQVADSSQLDVQNVHYQHQHLRDEIGRCNSYHLRHDLDLVPLEEFLRENPAYDKPDVDQHELMMARLRDEEKRRIDLFVRKTQLQKKKDTLAREVKLLRADLEDEAGLDREVDKFTEGLKPLRDFFYKH